VREPQSYAGSILGAPPHRVDEVFFGTPGCITLSLRFNHEEFCDGVKPIAKLSRSRFLLAQTFLLRAG
jgi:hypothetical protein